MRCQSELALTTLTLALFQTALPNTTFAASVTLESDAWALLVIPADPMGTTISSLFGKLLPASEYGQSWTVFTFDSIEGRYTHPAINDSLKPGQAFWTVQTTGQAIDVDLAPSLADSPGTPELPCAQGRTCISIPLTANTAPVTWNLVGVPLSAPTNTDDILFINTLNGHACSSGCSLNEAATNGHLGKELWVYDSAAESYKDAQSNDGVILPGMGFWVATGTLAAASSPAFHIPVAGNPEKNCTWFASPGGHNDNDGASVDTPLKSANLAAARLTAGDTLCLLSGTYPAPVVITNKTGTLAAPITVMSYSGNASDVIIKDGPASLKNGIVVTRSSHLHVANLQIQQVLRGIQYNSVTYGSITGNTVQQIQQEGIRVGALWNNQGLAGGPSSHVKIAANQVDTTGLRQGTNAYGFDYNEFGEGIYVGTGGFPGDATHDILVDNNVVLDSTAEAIEVKPYTRDIIVSNNTVSGSRLKYAGAISVAIGPETTEDGNYLVTNNTVFDIQSRQYSVAGIVIGQGNAVVSNNTVWDIEGGRGIRVYTTFVLPGADAVHIENNTVWNPLETNESIALHDNDGGFGLNSLATVTASGNITDDGSASSTQVMGTAFVGPIIGTADSGAGPGSGFRLRP